MHGSFEFTNNLCVFWFATERKILWNAYCCLINKMIKEEREEEKTRHNNFEITIIMNGCHNLFGWTRLVNTSFLKKRKCQCCNRAVKLWWNINRTMSGMRCQQDRQTPTHRYTKLDLILLYSVIFPLQFHLAFIDAWNQNSQ